MTAMFLVTRDLPTIDKKPPDRAWAAVFPELKCIARAESDVRNVLVAPLRILKSMNQPRPSHATRKQLLLQWRKTGHIESRDVLWNC